MACHEEDDDDFEEYNPHPYQGGYDIALTYGGPLPPSPAICYPVSEGSEPATSPLPPPPPVVSGHRPEPRDPTPPPCPAPEPDHSPAPSYDFSYRPENCWPDPDVYGFWPFVSERWMGSCAADVEEVGFWSQWKRAGDYLFGYSQGFGERMIGVDRYGIPIYADKKEASQPLTLQIEPATDLRLECYESDNWTSSYGERNVDVCGHAYNKYQRQEPFLVEENFSEPMLPRRLTCHEVLEEEVSPKLDWWISSYDERKAEIYSHAYNNYQRQGPLLVEKNFYEPILHQRLTYHEVLEGEVDPKQDWQTSYREYGDESNLGGNHPYSYERHHNEQPLYVELEPYKPTWSHNLNYLEFYSGEVSLESNYHHLADDGRVNQSNLSGEPNDACRSQCYEQPQCVELEPFKASWTQNRTFYESYMQEVPQSSWVDDSVKERGGDYFSPFLVYSQYDE